jgi:methionine-S-sulfoxide reductase
MTNREIWLAAGCFWGAQKFFKMVDGVILTEVGFANGWKVNPTYKEVYTDGTGHAECVHICYDADKVPLRELIGLFLKIVDPFSVNRQGEDEGTRYRTGIYYKDTERDLPEIEGVIQAFEESAGRAVAIEVEPVHCFYRAEEYHQNYLDKNPGGYCHLSPEIFELAKKR